MLPALFSRVWVTETVLGECLAGTAHDECELIQAAVRAGAIGVLPLANSHPAWGVDAGEASAIASALALNTGVVMDDRAGRRVAGRLGLPVIGTLGVLVLSKRAGLVSEIGPWIASLVKSGYYLADGVIQDALRLAGEFP